MIKIKPFRGYRPAKGLEDKIASKPYDVIDYDQALKIGKNNPLSYVHVIRPEIDMPANTNPYSDEVYTKAKGNLEEFIDKGYLVQEDREVLYIYRQVVEGRAQNGIVACVSIDDYGEDRIKKHELTRVDKEQDRINHFYYSEAHTEPVFLFYKRNEDIKNFIEEWTSSNNCTYDFISDDGVQQMLWIVDDEYSIKYIQILFLSLQNLYIADGHHRTASAYKVGQKMRLENPNYTGQEEFNYFMSVIFSDDELRINPYNRAVKDLNGYNQEEFLARVGERFDIKVLESLQQPLNRHEFTMILANQYYSLSAKEEIFDEKSIVEALDVSILQDNILAPVLGIEDIRTDTRIEFFGGDSMLDTIVNRLDKDFKVAFLLYPTQIEEVRAVSDAGNIMPPKSTWFEPKLMSGLFVHKFS